MGLATMLMHTLVLSQIIPRHRSTQRSLPPGSCNEGSCNGKTRFASYPIPEGILPPYVIQLRTVPSSIGDKNDAITLVLFNCTVRVQ